MTQLLAIFQNEDLGTMLTGMKSEAAITTLCGSTTSLAWICTLYDHGPPPAPMKAVLRACTKMTLTSEQCILSEVMQIKITKGTVAIIIETTCQLLKP